MLTSSQVDLVIKLAGEVSSCVLDFYNSNFQVYEKQDLSPVTDADLAASKLLEENLIKILDVPVVSEESSFINKAQPYLNWETFWLVDPIDGTKGFIKKTNEFCVCISLVHKNKSIFGLIASPTKSQIFYAQENKGAFKLHNNKLEKLPNFNKKNSPLILISRDRVGKKAEELLGNLVEYNFKPKGSALKYMDICEQKADLHLKLGDTCEWDTAAAQIILEECGGRLLDFKKQPLRYGTKKSLLNPHFLAYSNYLNNYFIDKNLFIDKIINKYNS